MNQIITDFDFSTDDAIDRWKELISNEATRQELAGERIGQEKGVLEQVGIFRQKAGIILTGSLAQQG